MKKLRAIARVREEHPVMKDGREVLFPSQALTLSQLKKLAPGLAREYRRRRAASRRLAAVVKEKNQPLPPAKVTLRGPKKSGWFSRFKAKILGWRGGAR